MNCFELGGFAEEPRDVSDAWTEEEQMKDFVAFNYCLAEEYASAMYKEDFESLGEMSGGLLDTICYWLNYDESYGNEEDVKHIANGTLLTVNNRTFIEAIVANKNISCADMYLGNQIYHPALIVMMMELYAHGEEYRNYFFFGISQETLNKIHEGLYNELEKNYQKAEDKIEYLRIIKKGFECLYVENSLKQKPIPKELSWVKALKNLNENK